MTDEEQTQEEKRAEELAKAKDDEARDIIKQRHDYEDLNESQFNDLMGMGIMIPPTAIESIPVTVMLDFLMGHRGSAHREAYELACERAVQENVIGYAWKNREKIQGQIRAEMARQSLQLPGQPGNGPLVPPGL